VVGEESAAVLQVEDPREPPLVVRERAEVEDVDHQDVARFGALDADRTAQVVVRREHHVADVVRVVAVLDLVAGPVETLDAELLARLDRLDRRRVRVPPVHDGVRLFVWRRLRVDLEHRLRHTVTRYNETVYIIRCSRVLTDSLSFILVRSL